MNIYEKVLLRLLSESTSLKNLPDSHVLKEPYTLVDKKGFNHYIIKALGDVFLVRDPDGNVKKYTYKELSKKFEGE